MGMFDSIMDNLENETPDILIGGALFLQIQKEESSNIMANIKKINSDKRLCNYRRSLVSTSKIIE